jgi:hypothetical protein
LAFGFLPLFPVVFLLVTISPPRSHPFFYKT